MTLCCELVANIALKKESFISSKRHYKRHVRNQWTHGHAARAVDGSTDQNLQSCTMLDSFYVDKPIWMVDLGTTMKISGVMIVTWQGQGEGRSLIGWTDDACPQARKQSYVASFCSTRVREAAPPLNSVAVGTLAVPVPSLYKGGRR